MAKAAWWLLRQFCGTRKILVGFAVFLNRFFISEPTAHTVVFFYFKFHFFFFERECGYRSSSTESSPNLCGKKSVLKKNPQNPQQTQKFSVGKEIIVSSKGENAGEGVGASLKSMRSDASGLWFFRQPEGSWGDLYPQPLHAPGRCPLHAREGITGSDRLGRRAYAPVPTLSPELGPLSPSGRTHAPRSGRGPANNHPLGRWHLRHLAPFSHNRHQGREGA